MRSTTISAVLVALSTLGVAAASHAELRVVTPEANVAGATGKTRAEVRQELVQAQREGVKVLGDDKAYPRVHIQTSKTRGQVLAELEQAQSTTPELLRVHR